MNKLLFIVCFIPFWTCGSKKIDTPTDKNKKFLEGLTIIEPQDYDSLAKINLFGASTVPFYTEDGELIPFSKKMEIITSGNYITTIYVDHKKNVKLWTARLLTDEEKRKAADTNSFPQQHHRLLDKQAPHFSIKDIDDKIISLSSLKGKIIVLNFWFIGCLPCIQELPELNKLREKYKDKNDVVFLAFAIDKKEKLLPFLKKHEFNYRVIPDSRSIHHAYEVPTCPTQMVIDRNSKIKLYFEGSIKPNVKNNVEEKIEDLLMNNIQ